jgi:hypothetical protein
MRERERERERERSDELTIYYLFSLMIIIAEFQEFYRYLTCFIC